MTNTRLRLIFASWAEKYKSNPADFSDDYSGDYGESCAKYFMKLSDSIDTETEVMEIMTGVVCNTSSKANDKNTRLSLISKMTNELSKIQANKYTVVCDEFTNPPELILTGAVSGYVKFFDEVLNQERKYKFSMITG